jgi:hypothetical protein
VLEKGTEGLVRGMAGWAYIIIACVPSMEAVSGRQIIAAEFGEEVTSLTHLRENTTEKVPGDGNVRLSHPRLCW